MFGFFKRDLGNAIEEGVKEGLDKTLPNLMRELTFDAMTASLEGTAEMFDKANPEVKFTGKQVAEILRKTAAGLGDDKPTK